jgi:predicted nucleic acid-binding Zn ribbon protein
MITGSETVGIFECAKLVVNESFRVNVAPLIVLGIAVLILYMMFLVIFSRMIKYRAYLKEHKKLEEFIIWEHRRRNRP